MRGRAGSPSEKHRVQRKQRPGRVGSFAAPDGAGTSGLWNWRCGPGRGQRHHGVSPGTHSLSPAFPKSGPKARLPRPAGFPGLRRPPSSGPAETPAQAGLRARGLAVHLPRPPPSPWPSTAPAWACPHPHPGPGPPFQLCPLNTPSALDSLLQSPLHLPPGSFSGVLHLSPGGQRLSLPVL